MFIASQSVPPPEWGGLTPLRDWDMACAVVSGTDIALVTNANGLVTAPLTGVASNLPTYVSSSANFNNKPAAAFSGTLRFTHDDLGVTTDGPCALVMVAKVTTDLGSNQHIWRFSNSHFGAYGSMLSANTWSAWHSADATTINSNDQATNASIILSTLSAGSQRMYVNSTTEESNAASSGCTYSGVGVVGNYPPAPSSSFSLNGEIARLMVFPAIPTLQQRRDIFGALAAKYGVVTSP